MSRHYARAYRRSHVWDARGEAKRAAAEAAGILIRTDDDARQPICLDLSGVGGKRLIIEPRRGHLLQWRVVDEFGTTLQGGALKTVLHAIADALPRAQLMND